MLPSKNAKVLDLGGGDGTLLRIMKVFDPSINTILWDKDTSSAEPADGLWAIEAPFEMEIDPVNLGEDLQDLDLIVLSEVIHLMPPPIWTGYCQKFAEYLIPGGNILIIDIQPTALLQWRLNEFSTQIPMLVTTDDVCLEMSGIGFKCIYSNMVEDHYFLRFRRE
jgi:SAM-dependent methyltransferase